jgi:hypothetical protein
VRKKSERENEKHEKGEGEMRNVKREKRKIWNEKREKGNDME